jgi:hypothetical protein
MIKQNAASLRGGGVFVFEVVRASTDESAAWRNCKTGIRFAEHAVGWVVFRP